VRTDYRPGPDIGAIAPGDRFVWILGPALQDPALIEFVLEAPVPPGIARRILQARQYLHAFILPRLELHGWHFTTLRAECLNVHRKGTTEPTTLWRIDAWHPEMNDPAFWDFGAQTAGGRQ
jgi:hypothetical protein